MLLVDYELAHLSLPISPNCTVREHIVIGQAALHAAWRTGFDGNLNFTKRLSVQDYFVFFFGFLASRFGAFLFPMSTVYACRKREQRESN
jgi:hypothetical protein